jgi:NitT/TauT family transport system permease protein
MKVNRFRKSWVVLPLALLFIWEATVRVTGLPPFILPGPLDVYARFVTALLDGSLLTHSLATMSEMLTGLATGTLAAILIGYVISKSSLFEHLVSPILVASQAVPVVAIAPLLVIWFGNGFFTKALICSLVVFFPVFVNTVVGLKSVPRGLSELMRTLKASKLQILLSLEIPSALAIFLSGLKIGATLSVIGAVVGEFVGSDMGLGFLINVGRGLYDTSLVFVAVFTLVFIALAIYGVVSFLEHTLLRWNDNRIFKG